MDVTNLTVPIILCFTISGVLISHVVWINSTFEKKEDSHDRHQSLEIRVTGHEKLLQTVARDVSYIRGRLEVEDEPSHGR